MRPDIVLFLSDQHTPLRSGYLGGLARTPVLEQLCQSGVSFTNAYTACPLCVPARMSMLLGQMPSKTGVFTNSDALGDNQATFVHALAAAGYETVLAGRMHFVGPDQRHGFMKRLVGDVTPVTRNVSLEKLRQIRGVYQLAFRETHCLKVMGGGPSPVYEYDKQVVAAAVDYLSRPHERPVFMVVGTYGPHFPYVGPQELYRYYRERVELPAGFESPPAYLNPQLRKRAQSCETDKEGALQALAAYCAMIEATDALVGQVRQAFQKSLAAQKREGVFCYLSDHGDQCGERALYGKQAFFESAVRIPMIWEGSSLRAGQRVDSPVSILDIGPTVCALAGAEYLGGRDGVSLLPALYGQLAGGERAVLAEQIEPSSAEKGRLMVSRMIRQGRYKLITYHRMEKWDLLFDLQEDPGETRNLLCGRPDIAEKLRARLAALPDMDAVEAQQGRRAENNALLARFETAAGADDSEMWTNNTDEARQPPVVV